MLRIGTLALTLTCVSLGALQTAHAQIDQLPPAPGTATTVSTASAVPNTYEGLRYTSNAVRVRSPLEIYNNIDGMEGKVVELQGEVAGSMARNGVRTIMLRVGDEMAVLRAGADIEVGPLRTGAMTSLLVKIERQESGNGVQLNVLATSKKVDAPPAPAQTTTPVMIDNSVIVVPPMTSMVLAPPSTGQSQSSQLSMAPPPASRQAPPRPEAPRAATPSSGLAASGTLDSMKPAYQALVRRYNKKLTEAQVDEIATAIILAANENKMDPRFLAAIIAVESDFDIYCLSSSGAMGLGQLMPFNLKEARIRDPWNPTQNVTGTARLLRGHLNDYANRSDGTLLAVAAYNAGPGAVRRAGYKVPSGKQVQRYVWKVYYRYKEFAPDKF